MKQVQFVYFKDSTYLSGPSVSMNAGVTAPVNTEGMEFLKCSITPLSRYNLLRINANVNFACGAGGQYVLALFQDSISTAIGTNMHTAGNDNLIPMPLTHHLIANTAGQITFTLRGAANGAGIVLFNGLASTGYAGNTMTSFISIEEFGR